jgi:ribonuclease T1
MNGTMKSNLLAGAAALVVMVLAFVFFSATGDDTSATDAVSVETSTAETTAATARYTDLPTIGVDDLPVEAVETLRLIDRGGPYPYPQDDGVFQNREGILPDRNRGHYREYTVDTPGSPDRGARRIVSGVDGERFYTDDHYDSFREILE